MTNKSHSLYPDLSNVTMLVTGANGGIGFDIVKSALMAGASLLATDLAIEEKLEQGGSFVKQLRVIKQELT